MSTKFYISDWHYGHKNVIAFDNRPFFTLEEMNQELIERWNSVVGKGDLVYILGDMFWCPPKEATPVIRKLNGQKILIKGNHDYCNNPEFLRNFAKAADYLEVDDEGRKVVLSHYPIPCFKNHFYGWYHLYGHVHKSFEYNMIENFKYQMENLYEKPCEMFNVGAMMPYMDYTPRTLSEILDAHEKEVNPFEVGTPKHGAKEAVVSKERLSEIKKTMEGLRKGGE